MQVMIILCKLPPAMEVVAQILSQTLPSKIKTLKLDGIVKAATLLFEQKGASCGGSGGKVPQANKLSTVKCKQADPKFAQQQQQAPKPQQQQGGSNGGDSRNAPAQGQGNRRGSRKAHAHREHAQNAEFATYVCYDDGPVPMVDPRTLAHTTGMTNYSPPAFDNTIKAFDLAHRLGVEPSCQTICTLDSVITTTSTNLDQPNASPSSLKHPHLEERITMNVKEDTISLGDEKDCPFIYEDFTDSEFNDVDKMILDHYNVVSMNWERRPACSGKYLPHVHCSLTLTHSLYMWLYACTVYSE